MPKELFPITPLRWGLFYCNYTKLLCTQKSNYYLGVTLYLPYYVTIMICKELQLLSQVNKLLLYCQKASSLMSNIYTSH